MRPGRDDRQESTTSCDDVAQVRRWSPSCVLRRPWRTKQVHEVDQTSHPTPRHSFIALSLPRSAQCPCNRKGGEEEKRRSLTSLQTCHTHTHPSRLEICGVFFKCCLLLSGDHVKTKGCFKHEETYSTGTEWLMLTQLSVDLHFVENSEDVRLDWQRTF